MKKKLAVVVFAVAPMLLAAGCSKPSESKLHDKLVSEAKSKGASDGQANTFADCAAKKMYDGLSASSLDTFIKSGLSSKVAKGDADKGNKILGDCATASQ